MFWVKGNDNEAQRFRTREKGDPAKNGTLARKE